MSGTNRTVRRAGGLLLAATLFLAAVVPANAHAVSPAPRIERAAVHHLDQGIKSTSVAIAPDGTPWFGLEDQVHTGPALGLVRHGKFSIDPSPPLSDYSSTGSLQFDGDGNLWFVRDQENGSSIVRRAPDGSEAQLSLPGGAGVNALTIGSEGGVWFTRSLYEEKGGVGRSSRDGVVTEISLADQATSLTAGPDGAIWFAEPGANAIGRVTNDGEITQFPLGRRVEPRRLVAGPDGAIWFTENGARHRDEKWDDRIGRLSSDGEVTQFPIRFGYETEALAVDPRGFIWFTTDTGEISSISTSGRLGERGCAISCGGLLQDMAVGPNGALWIAVGTPYCSGCGGGSDLIANLEGTEVIKVPPGALAPPER